VPAAWKQLSILLIGLNLATAATAGVVGWLTAQECSWSFVQKTGGIRIGQPVDRAGQLVLPVEYDITGTSAGVTHRPSLVNSGLVVRHIKAERTKNGRIVLVIVSQVIEVGNRPAGLHYAGLEGISTGAYDVYYEDAGDRDKFLGQIHVR
jgi:hypothetical protein